MTDKHVDTAHMWKANDEMRALPIVLAHLAYCLGAALRYDANGWPSRYSTNPS